MASKIRRLFPPRLSCFYFLCHFSEPLIRRATLPMLTSWDPIPRVLGVFVWVFFFLVLHVLGLTVPVLSGRKEEKKSQQATESETRHQDRQPAAPRPSLLTNRTLHGRRPKAAVRLQLVTKNCHEEQKLPTIRKLLLSHPPTPADTHTHETEGRRGGQNVSGGPLPAIVFPHHPPPVRPGRL